MVYGVRVGSAQTRYHAVRYGAQSDDLDALLRGVEAAAQRYPANYYFAYLAADRALAAALQAETAEQGERYLGAAEYWTRAGLLINPWRTEIQETRLRLLKAEGQLDEALDHWEAFVEREYWNPDHHAVLADLYMRAGRVEEAESALGMARRSRRYRALRREMEEETRQRYR